MSLFIFIIVAAIFLYRRYLPVYGVRRTHLKDLDLDKITVIDLRDYNVSYKNSIQGALNIPIAYLKRNSQEIPKRELHVIVSSLLEKNIGVRYLRKKGFAVVGYTMVNHHDIIVKKNGKKIETAC